MAIERAVFGPDRSRNAQRIEPQRLNLDRLTGARCHDPVTDFGVHPGQLVALLPLLQEAIVWIDGGLHATEVLGAQQLIQTVYELLSRDDAKDRIEAAGGKVTGMDGKEWDPYQGHILATNGLIHDEVFRLL